ncbi:MAG TPA: hypothetical protein DCP26_02375 [Brevundimonas sp.]|nr:hypothetical protein [Brevundimonas sp.]
MSRLQETKEVKALFKMLVCAVGGVEAAGVHLGVSHQRVSQLYSLNNDDEPGYRQIRVLEVAAGKAVVIGAHVKAVRGDEADCIQAAVVESVGATTNALRLVHDMDADGERDQGEIQAVRLAVVQAREAITRLEGKAATLQSGAVA